MWSMWAVGLYSRVASIEARVTRFSQAGQFLPSLVNHS